MATIIVQANASPVEDAEVLRKACQGWGTNEKAIIKVLGHRNESQRKQIREAYEQLYQEDLLKRLESELSGDFERAVYRWMLEASERDAVLANVAIKNKSDIIDYKVIIEISCINSPEELLAVKRAYQNRYKRSLEEDLAATTSGDLRKLLVATVGSYRYNGEEVNEGLAKSEANMLEEAIKAKSFNSDEINRILTTRSYAQINATFNRYRNDFKTSLAKDLLGESNNNFQKALHTMVRCISDPHKYYAKLLRDEIKKFGSDEESMTRVIVRRAEKDLKSIKEVFYKKNSVSVDDAVAKATSGDYKAFLLTILGNKED